MLPTQWSLAWLVHVGVELGVEEKRAAREACGVPLFSDEEEEEEEGEEEEEEEGKEGHDEGDGGGVEGVEDRARAANGPQTGDEAAAAASAAASSEQAAAQLNEDKERLRALVNLTLDSNADVGAAMEASVRTALPVSHPSPRLVRSERRFERGLAKMR